MLKCDITAVKAESRYNMHKVVEGTNALVVSGHKISLWLTVPIECCECTAP